MGVSNTSYILILETVNEESHQIIWHPSAYMHCYVHVHLFIKHKSITPTLYSVYSNPSTLLITLLILLRHLLLPSLNLRKRQLPPKAPA